MLTLLLHSADIKSIVYGIGTMPSLILGTYIRVNASSPYIGLTHYGGLKMTQNKAYIGSFIASKNGGSAAINTKKKACLEIFAIKIVNRERHKKILIYK